VNEIGICRPSQRPGFAIPKATPGSIQPLNAKRREGKVVRFTQPSNK
jgi:hypothetical protein